MSSYFPTPFYIYYHIDPDNYEIVYIGCGIKARAWTCDTHRSKEHGEYLTSLMLRGYTPEDWVHIKETNLNREAAFSLERQRIKELTPKFNKTPGIKLLKLNRDQLNSISDLRDQGFSYEKISKLFNVAPITIYRALNNSVRYKELRDE